MRKKAKARRALELAALALTALALGSAARATDVVQVGPRHRTGPQEERPRVSVSLRPDGATRDQAVSGELDPLTANGDWLGWSFAPRAAAGTYTGTVGGRTFSLTVNASNRITGWSSGGNYSCPGYSITSFSISGMSCPIAGDGTFTCGSLSCSPGGSSRISGAFGGSTVSGTFGLQVQPPTLACCSHSNVPFSAALPGGAPPAAPTNLMATPVSAARIDLDWQDNSNNENEFRVEMRQGTSGAFSDIGAVAADQEGASVTGLDAETLYQFRVRARGDDGDSGYSNVASATTLSEGAIECVPDDFTLCLNGGRFQVRATYQTNQASGDAHAVELTDDTGYLWFFRDSNVEAVIKVLDACGPYDRFWVFAGGLTNVETVITVTDTETTTVKTYTNPPRTPFQPIQDTDAFATCP